MAKIRDLAGAADKWSRNAQNATGDYEAGVRNPRTSWAQSAGAANEAYKQGVTQAANENRFATGVQAAGDDKWQRGAIQKGAQRFGAGVSGATGDYQAGFAPYAQVIQATALPPRRAKGDPSNIQRSAAMATALNAAKRARKGRK